MNALVNSKKNYITPKGLERLCDERDYLLKEERPRVTKIVTWAASLGDRSENADYQYGKKRLREIDRRLRFLGGRIESALVVDPTQTKSASVQFGARVTLESSEGQERIFTIVGADEINTKIGLISWLSPIAKSLLGRSVGDEVVVRAPAGDNEYEIISIDYGEIELTPFRAETLEEVFNK